jgi:hypothetical protein
VRAAAGGVDHPARRLADVLRGGGRAGRVWFVLWMLFYKNPRDQKLLSPEERDYILTARKRPRRRSRAKAGPRSCAAEFLVDRHPRFLSEPAWQTFNAWIPHMATERHMNIKEIAMFAWLPFLAADIGACWRLPEPVLPQALECRCSPRASW